MPQASHVGLPQPHLYFQDTRRCRSRPDLRSGLVNLPQVSHVGLPQPHLYFEKGKMRVGNVPLAPPETKHEFFYADA